MQWRQGPGGRWKTAFALAVAFVSIFLAYWLIDTLLLGFLALLLAILLDSMASPGIRFLHLRRGVAVVLAAVIFVVAVLAALSLVIVPLARQATDFVRQAPQKAAGIEKRLEKYKQDFPWLNRFFPEQTNEAQATSSSIQAPDLAKRAAVTVSAILDGAATALGVFFLGLFLALDPERWLRGMAQLWPGGSVDDRIALWRRVGGGLRGYLFMLGLYIVIMGAAWALGLWLIGVQYPLLFGAIGGLAEVVPYIGPMLGLIPPLIFALANGTSKVLWVLGLYVVLHILEGYVLVPYLMQRKEHLPPPLVIGSILVFGKLFGTLGVVLAVPLATAAYVVLDETVYAQRQRIESGGDGRHALKKGA